MLDPVTKEEIMSQLQKNMKKDTKQTSDHISSHKKASKYFQNIPYFLAIISLLSGITSFCIAPKQNESENRRPKTTHLQKGLAALSILCGILLTAHAGSYRIMKQKHFPSVKEDSIDRHSQIKKQRERS